MFKTLDCNLTLRLEQLTNSFRLFRLAHWLLLFASFHRWGMASIFRHDIYNNQGRIFAKGVGLELFPSDSRQSELYEFIEVGHRPYYGVGNDCTKFRSNRMDIFRENQKKFEKRPFFGQFWGNLGYVSHIPAIQL